MDRIIGNRFLAGPPRRRNCPAYNHITSLVHSYALRWSFGTILFLLLSSCDICATSSTTSISPLVDATPVDFLFHRFTCLFGVLTLLTADSSLTLVTNIHSPLAAASVIKQAIDALSGGYPSGNHTQLATPPSSKIWSTSRGQCIRNGEPLGKQYPCLLNSGEQNLIQP